MSEGDGPGEDLPAHMCVLWALCAALRPHLHTARETAMMVLSLSLSLSGSSLSLSRFYLSGLSLSLSINPSHAYTPPFIFLCYLT